MTSVHWKGWRVAAWAVLGVLAILAIFAGVRNGWQNGLILAGFLAVLAGYLAAQRSAPAVFNAVLVAAVTLNAVGWSWGLFQSVWGFDEIAHTVGTLAVTAVTAWYGYKPVHSALRRHGWVMLLAVFTLGAALGAWWEIIEWVGYQLFTRGKIQALDDKISDMVADSIGALLAAGMYRWALRQREPAGLPHGRT